MKCIYCGAELKENAKFCTACGNKVEAAAAVETPAEPQKKSKLKYILIPVIIGAGLTTLAVIGLIIALVVYAIFGAGGGLFGGAKDEAVGELDGFNDHNDYDDYDDHDDVYEPDDMYENTPVTLPYYEDEETEPETEAPKPPVETEPEFESAYADDQRIVIAHGGLRMRNLPDIASGAIVGLIPNGSVITVEKIQNNWAYTCVDGVYGWCSCDFLFEPYEYNGEPIYRARVNSAAGVDLTTENYVADDSFYTIIPNGEMILVYIVEGDRAFVKYNNIYGWCSTKDLEMRSLY